MKKILLLLLLFAGTLTMYGQTITTVAAGGTWNAARGTINANFEVTSDSLEILKTIKAPINSPTFTGNVTIATLILGATTITSNGTELNILDGALVNKDELNKLVGIGTDTIATRAYARSVGGGGTGDLMAADTADMLDPYARKASPTLTGVPKIGTDTIATRAYARQYGGSGTVTLADVQSEISDSLVNYVKDSEVAAITTGDIDSVRVVTGTIYAFDAGDTLDFHGAGGGTGDLMAADTADMLDPYILESEVAATYITDAAARAAINDSLNAIRILINDTIDIAEVAVMKNDTLAGGQYYTQRQVDSLAQDINGAVYDSTEITAVVPLLADTIPLFVFGAGSGATADTAVFNNSRVAGAFYNEGSDTLAVTQLMGVLKEGTGTETISVQISWHATFLSGSATNLNSSALAITSMTTGTTDTSFANAKIPPNVFVWCTLSGASSGNKPTFLSVTLSGYKIPTY